jgi:serine protease inhibitor
MLKTFIKLNWYGPFIGYIPISKNTYMQYTRLLLPLLAMILFSATPSSENIHPQTIANNNNDFAFNLFREIAKTEKENIFISPFSISTALAMTYAGADKNTADEMEKAMHFMPNNPAFHLGYGDYLKLLKSNAKDHIQLRIANRLWGEKQYELMPSFIELNKQAYESPLQKMNFKGNPEGCRKEINKWVEDKTEQRIKDLIPQGVIDSYTKLVLTNAIYFKGDWLYQFKKNKTKDSKFKLANGKTKKTPFMNWKGGLSYFENDMYKMVNLPYKGEKQSMVVILPHKTDDLGKLESLVNNETFEQLYYDYRPEVVLSLPKFKMTLPLTLNKYLLDLGIKDAFTSIADFSKMTFSNDLYISSVVHKAFIEIDEEGTEAAAATAVVVNVSDSEQNFPPKPMEFIADHPFLFYIVDNETKAILFMGRIMEPVLD